MTMARIASTAGSRIPIRLPEPSVSGAFLREDFRRRSLSQVLQDLEFVRHRQARRVEIAVVEKTPPPRVRVVHELAIHPFEVVGEPDRLAHPRILEFLAPRVDQVALK